MIEYDGKSTVIKSQRLIFGGGVLQEEVLESSRNEKDLNENTEDASTFQEAGM